MADDTQDDTIDKEVPSPDLSIELSHSTDDIARDKRNMDALLAAQDQNRMRNKANWIGLVFVLFGLNALAALAFAFFDYKMALVVAVNDVLFGIIIFFAYGQYEKKRGYYDAKEQKMEKKIEAEITEKDDGLEADIAVRQEEIKSDIVDVIESNTNSKIQESEK